jgi:hypothetical protein
MKKELRIYCFHVEATEKEHVVISKRMKEFLAAEQEENKKNLANISMTTKTFITPEFADNYKKREI